ncbi:MAG TPA: hypothetical protein VM534_04385 [Thermoanaerobaculia bacterium]|nr:hypothetical protein [Thermoanaerobaculia bacterium]
MSSADPLPGGTREETRQRQIRLGLSMTPLERLRWLDRRRGELRRLASLMEPPTGSAGSSGSSGDGV